MRTYDTLAWDMGNPETAEANMPVVSGFRAGVELAPMMVAENIFRRNVGRDVLTDTRNVVETWRRLV